MHLGATVAGIHARNGRPCLVLRQPGREDRQIEVDHVIAATGYRAAVSRLTFIDDALQPRVSTAEGAPMLNRHFESSVPGLHVVGAAAAANSFGPLLRFAYGAKFAAKRVAVRLAKN
jgi:pyruvate/2-oxoglutarate dehydrogenase complex dihydrolipoamide dehydrogenase (E3) component